jgi:hypothetical protein
MKRRIIIAAIVAVLIVPALSAQIPQGTIPDVNGKESYKSEVTFGLFGTEVDDIQDVNNWSDVEFTNGFGFVGVSSVGGVSGGYATHVGSLFLGITYDGYLWNGAVSHRKNDGKANDAALIYTDDPRVLFNNRLDVLIGSESFGGIKLLVFFNEFGRETNKNAVPTTATKSVNSDGSIYLAGIWGKNFSLGGGILKPEFGLGVQFDATDNYEYEAGSESVKYKGGYTSIALRAAADYEFAPKGNATTTLSGDYTFVLHIKPNPALEGKNGSPGISPFTGGPYNSYKVSDKGAFIQNYLNVFYGQRYDIDENISMAWKAGGGLTFHSFEEKISGSSTTAGVTSDLPDDKGTVTTEFGINPEAAVAFIYQFTGKPFSVNAGAGVKAGFTRESVNNKNSKIVNTTSTFSSLSPTLNLGGTLSPTENFTIDMKLSNTAGTNLNNFAFHFDATDIEVGFLLNFKI